MSLIEYAPISRVVRGSIISSHAHSYIHTQTNVHNVAALTEDMQAQIYAWMKMNTHAAA